MEKCLELEKEPNPEFSISDLWIELRIACGTVPARSQFYEWLKATWIVSPQPRGGLKTRQIYTQEDLNRLIKFHELKTQYGTLKATQDALLREIEANPTHYGA
jgi:hypothetical protein